MGVGTTEFTKLPLVQNSGVACQLVVINGQDMLMGTHEHRGCTAERKTPAVCVVHAYSTCAITFSFPLYVFLHLTNILHSRMMSPCGMAAGLGCQARLQWLLDGGHMPRVRWE